jgi:hypothetical protein
LPLSRFERDNLDPVTRQLVSQRASTGSEPMITTAFEFVDAIRSISICSALTYQLAFPLSSAGTSGSQRKSLNPRSK